MKNQENTIIVPDAVRQFYCDDKILESVTILLSPSSIKKISNYSWGDTRKYHQAFLSAQICRSQLIDFLFEVAENLTKSLDVYNVELLNDNSCYTVESIWDTAELCFNCMFQKNKIDVSLIIEEGNIVLYLGSNDNFGSIGEDEAKQYWQNSKPNVDGYFVTKTNLCHPISNPHKVVNITQLRKAFNNYLNQFK